MASDLRGNDDGAALVEAALVLPILLILVLGLMEIGLYLWTSALAAKAVQLGARRAILSDAVAVGPGLDPAESTAYWTGLKPGERCFPMAGGSGPCPSFAVACDIGEGCLCRGDGCGFRFSSERLAPILAAMRAILPTLKPENVRIAYETNGLGYVTRPGPVPVDVEVSLLGVHYEPLILGGIIGRSLTLVASAKRPGESLTTRR